MIFLTKNSDFDKHKYSEYGTGFDARVFSLSVGSEFGKSVMIFGADMSLFGHVDNIKKISSFLVRVQPKG